MLPCLPGFFGKELVAHFSVMLYCADIFMPQEFCYRPVIQMQFCQLNSVRPPEHMGAEFEQFPLIIPQIFAFYQSQHLMLYGCILKRAAGIFGIHEDVFRFTILIISTIDGFLDQRC